MHNRLRNLPTRKIRQILKELGFKFVGRGKGSHEIWEHPHTHHVVTVVAEKESFVRKTMKSMIEQSGRNEKDWLKALDA